MSSTASTSTPGRSCSTRGSISPCNWRSFSNVVGIGVPVTKNGPAGPFLRTGEMWSQECSSVAASARHDVALDAEDAAGVNQVVDEGVVPVPTPREPARELPLGRDHGGLHAGADEVAERTARLTVAALLRVHLVPAREQARVPVRLLVGDGTRDDGPAALERRAQTLQLLRGQRKLRLQVVELGRTCLRQVAQQPRPALVCGLHPLELGPADRIEHGRDLVADEEALSAVDRQDQMPSRTELPEPGELRRGPLAEARAVAGIWLLVTRLEQARQRRVAGTREQATIAEELVGLVERLERAVGRQAALEGPSLLELGERRHASSTIVTGPSFTSSTSI